MGWGWAGTGVSEYHKNFDLGSNTFIWGGGGAENQKHQFYAYGYTW